jgi:hypothetical protein
MIGALWSGRTPPGWERDAVEMRDPADPFEQVCLVGLQLDATAQEQSAPQSPSVRSREQRDPAEHPQDDQVQQPQSDPAILQEPSHRAQQNPR